jgi:ribonuclease Z
VLPLNFHPLPGGPSQVIIETDHITLETLPLTHRTPTFGFLFREKPKPWRLDKAKLPPDLSWDDRIRLKEGKDLLSDSGQLRYAGKDLTLPPRKSRSYAYCSDTAYNQQLMSTLQGVDLIYHEATFLDEKELQASKTLHSTARQAALIALGAGASRLLIGHFSARYRDLAPLLDEARAVFPATDLAVEGETFTLEE